MVNQDHPIVKTFKPIRLMTLSHSAQNIAVWNGPIARMRSLLNRPRRRAR
jgi:hypothetical protein